MNGSVAVFQRPSSCTTAANPTAPTSSSGWNCPATFVGQAILTPGDNHGAIARTLRNAIDNPTVGEPRQPDAIRIADQVRADQVRAEVAGTIPVTVAPTPHPGNRRTDSRARRAVPDPDRFPRRGRTQLLRSRMCLPRRRRDAVHRQRFPLRHHTLVPRRRQPPPPWPWPPSSPSTPRPSNAETFDPGSSGKRRLKPYGARSKAKAAQSSVSPWPPACQA